MTNEQKWTESSEAGQQGARSRSVAAPSSLMQPLRVLVVDDERLSREATVRQLRATGFVAQAVENGYLALESLADNRWDVVVSDLRMPGVDGLELLEKVKKSHADVDVIVMTAYGTVETAVAAIKQGASDYLNKPFRFQELEHRLRKLSELREFRKEVTELRALLTDSDDACCGLVGTSPPMRQVQQLIRTFAEHGAPVLITGETGTGKEMVTRAIHQLSPRADKPLVAVACGAIPTDLAESELFGHERGAFTGAVGQRQGAFQRADGGTLMLDDVDDLPMGLQVKLLRALEEKSFLRVGASRETRVDVRVVATSKRDLDIQASEGAFRQDLYYRLRALEIRLPPLRERGDDVLLLAEHFIRKFSGGKDVSLGIDAAALLRRYPWPGNVRELRHAMESCVIVCTGGQIAPECLPDFLRGEQPAETDGLFALNLSGRDRVCFNDAVRAFEDQLLRWAMREAQGQQSKAAEILGLPRTTLQSKLSRPNGNGHASG